MRLLLLSDIHGNYEAMKTAVNKEAYDEIIFLGDAVDYGPQPAEVVDFLNENASYSIMGNHDYAVIYDVDCKCAPLMHHLSEFSRLEISKKLLDRGHLEKMKKFSREREVEIDGVKMYMTHASPNNNMYGYLFSTEAEMVTRNKDLEQFKYIMVGHTHYPMLYKSRIVNPGSAGQPRDGNWKPWYAILETSTESIEFKRFKYDNQKTIDALKAVINEDAPEFKELAKFYLP